MSGAGSSDIHCLFEAYDSLSAKTDIRFDATSNEALTSVSVEFELLLVDD